jgi:ABC-2 type transport system permease protein
MNTQSNAVPESALESQRVAPAVMSATRPLYWSVRRELWENRSIYLAPMAVAGVILLGYLIALIHIPRHIQEMAEHQHMPHISPLGAIQQPYDVASGFIMGIALIVAVFYCLDALYGERRDRSILFWKSLPVSDLTAVLSKACIALLVLPLITMAITVATHWIMFLFNCAALLARGQSVAALWSQLPLFQMDLMLLYHLFTMHVLWWAPIYAWLLLISAWARRATFLWAFVPPLAISILEKIVFGTSHFSSLLSYRFSGDTAVNSATAGTFPFDPNMTHLFPGKFLSIPGLWIGLLVAAIFLAATVQLRRYRDPM